MTEASPEDLVEQQAPVRDDAPPDGPLPAEAPEADAAEQAAAASGTGGSGARDLPFEADPADASEQASEVELDEDERR